MGMHEIGAVHACIGHRTVMVRAAVSKWRKWVDWQQTSSSKRFTQVSIGVEEKFKLVLVGYACPHFIRNSMIDKASQL